MEKIEVNRNSKKGNRENEYRWNEKYCDIKGLALKENQKLKKPELIDVEAKKQNGKTTSKTEKDSKNYIVNEAQMLIADYISKVENNHKNEDFPYKKLKKKYQLLKKISCALAIGLVANIILLFAL